MNPTQQPQPPVVAPTVTSLQLPAPQTVVKDTKKVLSDLEKEWRSTAFWMHLVVQALTWVAYFHNQDPSLKFGSLTVSTTSLGAYLAHLVAKN